MRSTMTFSLVITLMMITACTQADNRGAGGEHTTSERAQQAGASRSEAVAPSNQAARETAAPGVVVQTQMVSLNQTEAAQQVPAPTERKIIRNANISIELDSPAEGQRKIASIAEARGGFIVTSESKQEGRRASDAPSYEVVTVEARIPASQFDAVVTEIRAIGSRVTGEKISGQDVTEEYIDLEARIRTQKALEGQFMEIMKQARTVADALEVQSQLANVRTEIERIEGRRRFLENQASMSTIKVTLQPPAPLIAATQSSFLRDLKEAFGDGFNVATSLVLGLIRLFIVLIPLTLFVFLPIGLVLRFLYRRQRRYRLAEQLRRQTDADAARA